MRGKVDLAVVVEGGHEQLEIVISDTNTYTRTDRERRREERRLEGWVSSVISA